MIDEFRLSKQIQDEIGYEAPSPSFAARGYLSDRLAARPDQSPRRHLRGERNLQWLAVAAAALLGIAVVAGLMWTRLEYRVSVPGDYGQPPAGVPLLYVRDPHHATWYIGFDWSGRPRGTVKLAQHLRPGQSLVMAPDGQLFQITPGGKAAAGQFLDRLGRRIPGSPPYADGIWADDNRHLCMALVDQTTLKWTLATQLPGEAPKTVAVKPAPSIIRGPSRTAAIACSIGNDAAIFLTTASATLVTEELPRTDLSIFRLTDGTPLLPGDGSGHTVTNIVASRDGAYIAFAELAYLPFPAPRWSTAVVSWSNTTEVATLPPNFWLLGFSGDDSLALVSTTPLVAGPVSLPDAHPMIPISRRSTQASMLEVINIRSGQVVWRGEGSSVYSGFTAEPGGRDFAISFGATGSQTSGAVQTGSTLSTILIVHGDGSFTMLPQPYLPTW